MWEHYFPCMYRLTRALAAMQLSLCTGCFRKHFRKMANEDKILLGRGNDTIYHHHAGCVQNTLGDSAPIDTATMRKWFVNREHGLFHGLCTAIMGAMAKPHRLITKEAMVTQMQSADPWASKYFVSAVLHDFCRGGMDIEDGHDAALEKVFPGLLPETYTHASPAADIENEPLIFGDRLELLRFPNHKDWVKPPVLEQLRAASNPYFVDFFYRIVRPALALLFFHEDEVWMRHGLENRSKGIESPDHDWAKGYFPQAGSYFNVRDKANEHGFSVEICRGGLLQCVQHGAQWVHVQGITPVRHFIAQGGEVKRCESTVAPYGTFDHLCGVGAAPLSSWVFLYHEPLNDPGVKGQYRGNLYKDCLQSMVQNGVLLIPLALAEAWRRIADQWRVRLELLCVYGQEGAS